MILFTSPTFRGETPVGVYVKLADGHGAPACARIHSVSRKSNPSQVDMFIPSSLKREA